MYALFVYNGFVNGYIETTEEAAQEFELDYVLVNEVPNILREPQVSGRRFSIDPTTKNVTAIDEEKPKTELDLIKEDNIQLNLQMIDMWETLINAGVV